MALEREQGAGRREAGDRVARLKPEVVRRWEEEARRQVPGAEDKPPPVLLDHVPAFLDRLADCLCEGEGQDLSLETGAGTTGATGGLASPSVTDGGLPSGAAPVIPGAGPNQPGDPNNPNSPFNPNNPNPQVPQPTM